ncbi:MAG: hypothetical protein V3U15_04325 [Nitrospinota bacterium]
MKPPNISGVRGQGSKGKPIIFFVAFVIFVVNHLAVLVPNLNQKVVSAASLPHLDEALSKQEQEGVVKGGEKRFEILTPKDRKEFEKLLKKALGVSLFDTKEKVSRKILKHKWRTRPGKHVLRVYATSFGKPGNKGESRYFKDGSKVRWGVVAAALPDPSAIGKWVDVRRIAVNGERTRWVKMKVRDLGPWFRNDPYWKKKSKQPRAVRYFKNKEERFDGRVVINPAGIDITPWGWQKLGIPARKSYNHSQHVEWRFAG